MADGPNDYYDIIREKITDPEIQKALDAFHARGVQEQRQARESDGGSFGAPVPAGEAPEPLPPGGRRASAPEGDGRPSGGGTRSTETGTKNYKTERDIPNNGQGGRRPSPSPARDPAVFRRYMQASGRQSVYPDAYPDTSADDAYEAAYRDAIRKAAGGRSAGGDPKRGRFAAGLLVVLFAVFGLGCAVFFSVKGISSLRAKQDEERCAAYNTKLIPVAAVDPDAFEDISAARMEDLIKIAVWQMIGSGVDPNRYAYANGELCLPQADVEAVYTACFGTQVPILHQTVEGYGYTAKYSAEDAAYFIPMTTLEPIYTPRVVSVETKNGAAVVTCGLISSDMWKQDRETGDITVPEPDKYVRVTFRTASGAEYISSLQSLGLPETALPSGAPVLPSENEPAETSPPPAETTTGKQIVITWD